MNGIERLFEQGGPTMYAIVGVAFVGIALFLERIMVLRGVIGQVHAVDRRIRDAVLAGNVPEVVACCAKAPFGLAPVLMRGVEAHMRRNDRDAVLDEMARDGRRLTFKLRRGLGLLATLGTMSPFLGLFGTVLGIMQALRRIGETGGGGLDVVAGGVSEALVDTAAGIIVAVALVLLHQILRAIMNKAVLEVQVLVEDVADHLSRLPPHRVEEVRHGAA